LSNSCVSVDRLLGFAAGRLGEEQNDSVRAHICACHDCMMELQLATSIVPVGSTATASTRIYAGLPSFSKN